MHSTSGGHLLSPVLTTVSATRQIVGSGMKSDRVHRTQFLQEAEAAATWTCSPRVPRVQGAGEAVGATSCVPSHVPSCSLGGKPPGCAHLGSHHVTQAPVGFQVVPLLRSPT